MLGSILLLDDSKRFLENGYAAGLPAFFNAAIDGVRIGPEVGSCGTAAYKGQRVIVEDIATHPYWKDYAELARSANLAACWSEPIRSPSDEMLGTLAMYFHEPQIPKLSDLDLLKHSAQLAGIVLDRARTRDRVRKSEQRYRSLVEASTSIVWTASPKGLFVTPQIAWEDHTDQPWKLHQGAGWLEMIHPDDREPLTACWQLAVESGADYQSCGRMWHEASQAYRYFEVRAVPIRDDHGKVVEWVGTTTDDHERRTAEKTLQINEERLSLALRATTDAIWDFDVQTGKVWWNEAYQKQFGRPAATKDSRQWWIDRIHPADCERVMLSLETFMNETANSDRWEEEYRFLRANGNYAYINDRALRACDENGKTVRILGAMLDVTERRALEKQVLESSTETQRAISHDLHDGVGQELTGLAMLADSLREALSRKSLPECGLAEKIGIGIERTLKQVRTLARGMNPVEVVPRGLISALTELGEHAQQLYGIECCVRCSKEIAIGDSATATQLFRIAQEAITNAVRHGKAAKINLELLQFDDYVELQIRDNGAGIADHGAIQKGTGMRSMNYRANVVGGKLRVQNGPKNGTIVTCTIPTKPAASSENLPRDDRDK